MGCSSCSTANGKPGGCKSNGGCSSGGCNRLNTYDWLAKMEINDPLESDIVEVSFKNGARKDFFINPAQNKCITGDSVVVESGNGYDVGIISLSGELVKLQMKKKKIRPDVQLHKVIRKANDRDVEKLWEAREMEKNIMVKARVVARTLGLEMKVGDVEVQGDKRKATFFYTADGRVDFRELIRHYAKEFKLKIEMRQIGARQESARIGGLGSCGRELCCSTWLSDFKSVSTAAARYQNLAINQSKLSGQCGRLKCCLNYELDTYMDALEDFPKSADKLYTEVGTAVLVKTDIFKGVMYYCYISDSGIRGKFYPLEVARVKEILAMNAKKERPTDLIDLASLIAEEEEMDYENVHNVIDLPMEKRKRKRNRKKKSSGKKPDSRSRSGSRDDRKKTDNKGPKNQTKGNAKPSNKKDGPKPKNKDVNPSAPKKNNNNSNSNKAPGNNPEQNKKPNKNRRYKRKPRPNKKPTDNRGPKKDD